MGLRARGLEAAAGTRRRITSAGAVALTFDDGPHPGTTDQVLELLAANDVRATFFCVGRNAEAHPELVRRIRAEGHVVGSHSYTHPDPEVTGLAELGRDYRRGRQALCDILGEDVALFRPPRGFLDPARAVQLRALAIRLRLQPWLWSVDPWDWHPATSAATIAAKVGRAEAGDVVLLHDWVELAQDPSVLDRRETLAALPELIARSRAGGLEFATLSGPSSGTGAT